MKRSPIACNDICIDCQPLYVSFTTSSLTVLPSQQFVYVDGVPGGASHNEIVLHCQNTLQCLKSILVTMAPSFPVTAVTVHIDITINFMSAGQVFTCLYNTKHIHTHT